MSSGSSSVKWGRVVIGTLVGFLIGVVGNLILQTIYGVVLGFQARGMPPQDQMIAAIKSLPFQILAALLILLGGFIGGRMAARDAESDHLKAGLITGVLLAILVAAWRAFSWGPDLGMGIHAVLAIVGGWLGGQLAASRTGEEYDESPQL